MILAAQLTCLLLGASPVLFVETFDRPDGPLQSRHWSAASGEFVVRRGRLHVTSHRSNPVLTWRGELASDVTIRARLINAPTCHWSGILVKSRFAVTVNRQYGYLAITDTQGKGGQQLLSSCPGWTTYVNNPFDFRLRVAIRGTHIYAFADGRLMAEADHPAASGSGSLALLGGWGTSVAWDDIRIEQGADLSARPQEVPADVQRNDAIRITAARWDDPHGIYAPGARARLSMTIANPRDAAFIGLLRLRLIDFWGEEVASRSSPLTLPPHATAELVHNFTLPRPGIFKVAVDAGPDRAHLSWVEDLISVAAIPRDIGADRRPHPESLFGGHVDAIRLQWHLDLATRLGMKWLRNHDAIQWTWWERTEPADDQWRWYDDSLQQLLDRGLLLLGEFLRTPAWAADAPPNLDLAANPAAARAYPPSNWQEFAEYVYETVRHYRGRIRNWEVWNEPYYGGFWKGTPEQYARLASIAYRECKRADPACTVWAGCIHLSALPWLEQALQAGLAGSMDGLSMHGYYSAAVLDGAQTPYGGLPALRRLLARYGREHVRIWDTEAGVPSTSFLDQYRAGVSEPDAKYHYRNAAGELVRMYAEHAAQGIEKLFYYTCIFTRQPWPARPEPWPAGKPISTHMVDAGGVIKPIGVAYATCARWLDGSKFVRRLDTPAGLRAYLFTRRGQTIAVVMGRVGFGRLLRLSAPKVPWISAPPTQLRDIMNAPMKLAAAQGRLTLTASRLPWFLITAAAPQSVAKWLESATVAGQ